MAPSLEVESISDASALLTEKTRPAVGDAREQVKNDDPSAVQLPVRGSSTVFELEDHPVDAKPHIKVLMFIFPSPHP